MCYPLERIFYDVSNIFNNDAPFLNKVCATEFQWKNNFFHEINTQSTKPFPV